jgi:peptidylprolyl isomerase
MRTFFVIWGMAFAVAVLGCGGGDATTSSAGSKAGSEEAETESTFDSDQDQASPPVFLDPDNPHFATITGSTRPTPVIHPNDGPAPERFVARDIEIGSGPVARPGDRVAVLYIGVSTLTGKVQYETWPPREGPLIVELGLNGNSEDWEEGVVGMRVGGRREMIVPGDPYFEKDPLDYIFELARVESGR